MRSLRSYEGYLLIDNRNNEGVPGGLAHASNPDLPVSFGRGVFEAPTITCSHCGSVVIINPNRQRERSFCAKCNHYLCDGCGVILAQTKECTPWLKVIEKVQERAARQEQRSSIILPAGVQPIPEPLPNGRRTT
jgi:hypothetical protein